MIEVSPQYKKQVVDALLAYKDNFDLSDKDYAKKFRINSSVYSRLKGGENPDGLIKGVKWFEIGLLLDVLPESKKWKTVETETFLAVKEALINCQIKKMSILMVDDPGIGKSYTAKYMQKELKNYFYIDLSQCKKKSAFIRHFAETMGIDSNQRIDDLKKRIKYMLQILPNPLVCLDEVGDADNSVILEVKEFWNATEKRCGWMMMGADGLRRKIDSGVTLKKAGFTEILSRFGDRFTHVVPVGKEQKEEFYQKMIYEVVAANVSNATLINKIVKQAMIKENGRITGLRRVEHLIDLVA
jgi:nitrogen regulatory protein PII